MKSVCVYTHRCVRILGKQENIRVVQLTLFQGVAKSMKAAPTVEMKASDNPALQSNDPDPTVFCTAFKKNRFYMVRTFSVRNQAGAPTARVLSCSLKPSHSESLHTLLFH